MFRFCLTIVIFCALSEGFPTTTMDKSVSSTYPNERIFSKLGEANNPATSCRHITSERWFPRNGKFWINPTKSRDRRDSFLVYCDLALGGTCIYPETKCSKVIDISKAKREVWLGKIDPEFKNLYKMMPDQLSALQNMSGIAIQNVTYHCQNSVAYYDNETKSFDYGLKLIGDDRVEINARSNQDLRFQPSTLLHDGCRYKRPNRWFKTKLSVITEHPSHLPIRDIAIRDFGKPMQIFFVELGPVCFY